MSQEFEDRALQDGEFEEYLRRDSEVSQRYRELGGREVPPVLDAKVLRQAQQHAAKSSGRRRPWLRWGTPLALAATALIAITVVMQPEVNAPRALQPMVVAEAPVAESQESLAGDYRADSAALDEAASAAPESERPAGEKDSASSDALAPPAAEPKPAAGATQPAAQPGASSPASARANSSIARDSDLLDESSEAAAARERNVRRMPGSAAAPAESNRAVEQRRMKQVSEPVSPSALDRLAASSAESDAKRKQEESGVKSDAAPPVPAAAAPAPAPAVAPPPPAATALLRAPVVPPLPAPAPAGASTLEADRTIEPAVWVRWIRDLRAQNNQARVAELLGRLRAAHPGFELPADIAPPSPQR